MPLEFQEPDCLLDIVYCYGPKLFAQGKKQQRQQQLKDESMSYIIDGNVCTLEFYSYTQSFKTKAHGPNYKENNNWSGSTELFMVLKFFTAP